MRAGVHLVGSGRMLSKLADDKSLDQAVNVASLPGVLDPVLTMADIHQGYGFPIGGVAAFHAVNGVVSPGGVGYDINCGVRMLRSPFRREELSEETLQKLVNRLFDRIPCGIGSKRGDLHLSSGELEAVLREGAGWAAKRGFGKRGDTESIEERGCLPWAEPKYVSPRARERGENQLGTLGSGNHFVEIQMVDRIDDEKIAEGFGLFLNQIVVTIHTGSRGLGYQVCTDSLDSTLAAAKKYGVELPDRELAAAPIESPEGQAYLGAMASAANFAFANRQVIAHWVREAFDEIAGRGDLEVLYDVCHNIAKFEEFPGRPKVCIHRKGATRAYPPGHPGVPPQYRDFGQPVMVPGDMGRFSYVLAGKKGSLEKSFGSACHGAGRELSRAQAKKRGKGRDMEKELRDQGIWLRAAGRHTALEEMPEAYKDAAEVVAATADAGIATLVARVKPLAVIKG
jgi:tRNA-splicing ligase RtcB (3'-phosphate/5'-hydroxy nucleic acid ligase)